MQKKPELKLRLKECQMTKASDSATMFSMAEMADRLQLLKRRKQVCLLKREGIR